MCGRFTLYHPFELLLERFQISYYQEELPLDFTPRYNIAPTQPVIAAVHDGEKVRAGFMRWGLIPSWSKDSSIGSKMINARAETLQQKPSFKNLISRRRCIILASGFYEWKKLDASQKQPVYIHLDKHLPFAVAGLWDRWRDEQGNSFTTCTIITTQPNEMMADIHDRMPVILSPENELKWLHPQQDWNTLADLLKPYPAKMDYYPVMPTVNSPRYDHAELIQPLQ